MRFGGFTSYSKFKESWQGYKILLPVDYKALNIYLANYPGTPKEFAERHIPEEIRESTYKKLISTPLSYWWNGRTRQRPKVNIDWYYILALAQAFGVDPCLFFDELSYYTELREKKTYKYYYGAKFHKIPFTAWQQGLSVDALIPHYFYANKEPEERRKLFIKYNLVPHFSGTNRKTTTATYRINVLLDVSEKLGIPTKDMFIQERRVELSCFGAIHNALMLMSESDLKLYYAIAEVIASKKFHNDNDLKEAFCTLVDHRHRWG